MVKVKVKAVAFVIVAKIVFVLMIADSLMDWLMNVLMLFRRELGKEVTSRVLSA